MLIFTKYVVQSRSQRFFVQWKKVILGQLRVNWCTKQHHYHWIRFEKSSFGGWSINKLIWFTCLSSEKNYQLFMIRQKFLIFFMSNNSSAKFKRSIKVQLAATIHQNALDIHSPNFNNSVSTRCAYNLCMLTISSLWV